MLRQCHWPASIPDTPFQQAYANMSAALNATGRAIHFNMCEWGVANPWEWGPALAQVSYGEISLAEENSGSERRLTVCLWGQSWRVTGDHVARWSNVVVDEDGPDNLGTKEVIAERSRIPPALGGAPFGWNDVRATARASTAFVALV